MSDLCGQGGTLTFKLQITRAATGETEEVDLVGRVSAEQAAVLTAEIEDFQQSAEAQKD